MCGVFGAFNLGVDESILCSCVKKLTHRGPDGEGRWKDRYIWLGHRRLSILDLSDKGKQPMSYCNGRYVITYNGEVYNYLELREELESLGHVFKSSTDTEVVIAAFCEWKEKCLNKFNGMFSFAIWDTIECRLFIARDRFGVKPLYYIDGGNAEKYQLAFASEMKALMPLIDKPSYNNELLRNKDSMLYYEGGRKCIINEVNRFPAAHYAWVDTGGMKLVRWWNTLDNLIQVPKRYDEQAEMFCELFTSACKMRMRSDVEIGTALSGGIDSSAVISTIAHILNGNKDGGTSHCRAFVATFPDTTIDERIYAESVVDFWGYKADYVNIDYTTLLKNIEQDMYYFEDVYLTPPTTMSRIYRQMKREGVGVTIDGHGADELFCGYNMDVPIAFYDAMFSKGKIQSIAETYIGLYSEEDQNRLQKEFSYWKLYKPWMFNQMAAVIKKQDLVKRPIGVGQKEWGKLDYLSRHLYLRAHENILPTLLRNYDRYSMMNGVEIRMPFLDYRIVEFAFSIGWQSKLRNGYTKAIVRDGMKRRMPQNVVRRKSKIGFSSPLLEWTRGPLREVILDMLSSQEFKNSDLVDVVQAKRKMDEIMQNPKATQEDAEGLWMLIQPLLWKKFFWDKCVNM